MSKQNNGGPAFPCSARLVAPDTYEHLTNGGMTLRDYFAAKAMQAVLVNGYFDKFESVASDAYKLADAMLRAREAS
ncbi:hypothetical protein KE017_004830 [Citrobacter freundii]|nr:hypothetical protein [Citrobacter freundii]